MQEGNQKEEYFDYEDVDVSENIGWKGKLMAITEAKYFFPVVIVLISVMSFCLGRISGLQEKREPVRILYDNSGEVKGASDVSATAIGDTEAQMRQTSKTGSVVASKSGTKYYYPWCSGANRISPKNLITFDSTEAARAAGYTPASNCKGLK